MYGRIFLYGSPDPLLVGLKGKPEGHPQFWGVLSVICCLGRFVGVLFMCCAFRSLCPVWSKAEWHRFIGSKVPKAIRWATRQPVASKFVQVFLPFPFNKKGKGHDCQANFAEGHVARVVHIFLTGYGINLVLGARNLKLFVGTPTRPPIPQTSAGPRRTPAFTCGKRCRRWLVLPLSNSSCPADACVHATSEHDMFPCRCFLWSQGDGCGFIVQKRMSEWVDGQQVLIEGEPLAGVSARVGPVSRGFHCEMDWLDRLLPLQSLALLAHFTTWSVDCMSWVGLLRLCKLNMG